ncbi:hypothetical protein GCM10022254_74930 [Actinomadura meridiana]|uniref:GAF domain-containing protein n=1 Tax=Actinomadura meridiana TaxID=559626 RepID=A0ABP8CQY0_9ACTN
MLADLGLAALVQDEEFDAFAAQTAAAFAAELGPAAEGLYAMVNLITVQQTFVGLHNPPGEKPVDRTMSRDHGWCPEVVNRRAALVLPDVYAWPRFSGGHVVDSIGIRTYAGAPIAHGPSGTVFGTVCVVGAAALPEETDHVSLALIKDHASRVAALIEERTGQPITSQLHAADPDGIAPGGRASRPEPG